MFTFRPLRRKDVFGGKFYMSEEEFPGSKLQDLVQD